MSGGDKTANDGGHGPSSGFLRLVDNFGRLVELPVLNAEQSQLLQRRMALLFDRRDRFLMKFRSTFDAETFEACRATRQNGAALTAQQLEDEALHLFALAQLTLTEGAETMGHLERTAGYAKALAEARGEDAVFVAMFGHAALIHDIGLLVVPEDVFARRGLVDSYESALIDTHTRLGAELIDAIMQSLDVVDGPLVLGRDIVYCHHERYDGLGPQGLAGKAIPYVARLFAIVDVYDTLRRRRPHRESLDHAAAIRSVPAIAMVGRSSILNCYRHSSIVLSVSMPRSVPWLTPPEVTVGTSSPGFV